VGPKYLAGKAVRVAARACTVHCVLVSCRVAVLSVGCPKKVQISYVTDGRSFLHDSGAPNLVTAIRHAKSIDAWRASIIFGYGCTLAKCVSDSVLQCSVSNFTKFHLVV
jgi:hypothetical protein